MSKELEALEKIGNILATGGAVINQTTNFEILKQALVELEILRKVPTSEEVCKALENYFGYPHYYQDNFFYRSDGMKYIWAVKRSGVLEIGHAYETLPTHLFIMIGKFYKSEVEKYV